MRITGCSGTGDHFIVHRLIFRTGQIRHLILSDTQMIEGLMADQVDLIDEDLEALEEEFYGDEDECDCDGCSDEDFDGDLYEVQCPACGDTICIDEETLEQGEIECPNCGELLEFDLEEECEDEGCDCGCCGHDHDAE